MFRPLATPLRSSFTAACLLAATPLASAQWAAYPLDPGAQWSDALGGDALGQAGAIGVSGQPHAALWNGTAGSFVDLHPAGLVYSRCAAARGGVQGGWASNGIAEHAGRWTGSASTWVDLHPSGYGSSRLSAVDGTTSVGMALPFGSSNAHAALWSGASSFTDLHPAGATFS